MRTVYKGIVHPWLCDVMGHMTTRHYLAMFDDASYHMIAEVFEAPLGAEGGGSDGGGGSDRAGTEKKRKTGWVDVRQVLEYKDELKAGEMCFVRGGVRKIGTKSITFFYEMINSGTGALSATLETTSVYFDMDARKGLALTDRMRALAEANLE